MAILNYAYRRQSGSSVGSRGILLECMPKILALFAFVFGYRLKWVGGWHCCSRTNNSTSTSYISYTSYTSCTSCNNSTTNPISPLHTPSIRPTRCFPPPPPQPINPSTPTTTLSSKKFIASTHFVGRVIDFD